MKKPQPRIPRRLKKAISKAVLTLDVGAIPRGVNVDTWVHYYQTYGIAVYDSTRGERPKLLSRPNKRIKIKNVKL